MATITQLIEDFSRWTSMRPSDGRVRARHLREAGFLPMKGRGRGAAHVNSLHCAAYLNGYLGAEQAINGPAAVECFADLYPYKVHGNPMNLSDEAKEAFYTPTGKTWRKSFVDASGRPFFLPERTLLEAAALLIEWGRNEAATSFIERNVASIRCNRYWPNAGIVLCGENGGMVEQEYRQRPQDDKTSHVKVRWYQMARLSAAVPLEVNASIGGEIFSMLGLACGEREELRPLREMSISQSFN